MRGDTNVLRNCPTRSPQRRRCDLGHALTQSRQQFAPHLACDVREPEVAPFKPMRQLLVIETEQPQDRRLQVVHMDRRLCDAVAEFVRRPHHGSLLDAAASEQHREAMRVMVAPALLSLKTMLLR